MAKEKLASKNEVPIMVRVNEAQHGAFVNRARQLGLSTSAWIRMILLAEVRKAKAAARR